MPLPTPPRPASPELPPLCMHAHVRSHAHMASQRGKRGGTAPSLPAHKPGTPHFAMHPRSYASADLKMRRRRRSETRGALPGAKRDMCCSSVTTRRTTGASPGFCADVARRVPGADVGPCRRWLVSRCSLDIYPSDGTGCDGGPGTVNTCGSCGILYDVSYPVGARLL